MPKLAGQLYKIYERTLIMPFGSFGWTLRKLLIRARTQDNVVFPPSCELGKYFVFSYKGGKGGFGANLKIREFCKLNINGGTLQIGDNFFMNAYSSINCKHGITIGDNVLVGENVHFYDHDHDHKTSGIVRENGFIKAPIAIGDNVWIGSGALILKGVTIGDNAVVAAGSVVTKNIPAGHIVIRDDIREIIRSG